MNSRRHREGGAAAVEFALIAPIFIALVFAVISYGYMLSFRQSISQAAAEGARVYATAPSGSTATRTDAIAAVNRALTSYGVTCTSGGGLTRNGSAVGTCTVPTTTSACAGSSSASRCATVAISYSYRNNPLMPSFPGLGITLPSTLSFNTTVEVNS
ncbi:hypothetical protein ASD11_12505 [Aeromicrobium sp. Root495]|uniref:TadE/TadG family type IV pilus assembly protein n=1 Tax=Aeromicrobium sp. Root495 TaxID=1736550 RepID=UPI000701F221|nr:TadE/TadG family type IV pilus assembly protein [Aeromicrobium sp. Root495]KQY60277.1 hypothetical protein ASD11_12505 [Aeromicrobium sp. Root495]